jgi:hypothetical protein
MSATGWRPGKLLALIDPIDLDQRIAAASGSAGRSAALEQAAASQVADASARLALARSEAARGEELFRGGWLTRTALDQRRQALAAAEAGLAASAGQPFGRLCRIAAGPGRSGRPCRSRRPTCVWSPPKPGWSSAALPNRARPWWPGRP